MAQIKSMSAKKRERANRYADMRLKGWALSEIAVREGVTENTVTKLLNEVLAELNARTLGYAYGVQQMELERLDRLWRAAFEQAEAGELAAVDRCLKIMERRSNLLGLDAPKHQVHHVAQQEDDSQREKDITPVQTPGDLEQLGDALRRIGYDPANLPATSDGIQDAEVVEPADKPKDDEG